MATGQLGMVVRHLRGVLTQPDAAALPDGDLVKRYARHRDPAAFEALLRRHGPMVMGVCRRVLRHAHDAEDAFQATFLLLVRKAPTLRSPGTVGNWLYGVAYRTALEARRLAARRRAKEAQVVPPEQPPEDPWAGLRPVLDQELERLPEKYRAVLVLCDLEGKTRKEAARHLGWPEGTVASRLATARATLARRLARHGPAVSGGALAALLARDATAGVPPAVVSATVHAAGLFAAGAAGMVSVQVTALTQGVLKTMLLTKLKVTTAILLAAALVTAGATLPAYHALAVAGTTSPTAHAPTPARVTLPSRTAPPPATGPDALASAADDDDRKIRGSGNVITKDLKLADFTSVEVSRSLRVEITQAAAFRVRVTAEDNLLPYVKASKDGQTLKLSLDTKNKSIWATAPIKATVAMPTLERVTAAQAARVTCKGFQSGKSFRARVTDASTLDGDIKAGEVDLDAARASSLTLKGSAKRARIKASQASRLSLDDFTIDRADVTLEEASSARIHVTANLDYELRTASRLEYRGRPMLGKREVSGASSVGNFVGDAGRQETWHAWDGPHDATFWQQHLAAIHAPFPHLRALHPMPHHGNGHHAAEQAQLARNQDAAPAPPARVAVGEKVPDFTLQTLDGKVVKLSELRKDARRTRSGVVVLSFWCSFCGSCRRVEHRLDALAKAYDGQALVLALDASAGETPDKVTAFARKEGLALPILLDEDGHTPDVFGTSVTTTTAVIDAAGVLRYCGRFSDGDRAYAADALKAVLAGEAVAVKTTRHDGCAIVRK